MAKTKVLKEPTPTFISMSKGNTTTTRSSGGAGGGPRAVVSVGILDTRRRRVSGNTGAARPSGWGLTRGYLRELPATTHAVDRVEPVRGGG